MSVVRNIKVYLGLAPDDEYSDLEYGYAEDLDAYEDERPQRSAPAPRSMEEDVSIGDVRPMPRTTRSEPRTRPTPETRRVEPSRSTEPATVTVRRPEAQEKEPEEVSPRVRRPTRFSDAKSIADDFRRPAPVVMEVADLDRDLSRRLIDFASGLCYGLDGRMEKLTSTSFLLLPEGLAVSDRDRARYSDR